jgi:hypothetical protein
MTLPALVYNTRARINMTDKEIDRYIHGKELREQVKKNPYCTVKMYKKGNRHEIELDTNKKTITVPDDLIVPLTSLKDDKVPELDIQKTAEYPPKIRYYFTNFNISGQLKWRWNSDKQEHEPLKISCVGICEMPGTPGKFIRAMSCLCIDKRRPKDVMCEICKTLGIDADLMFQYLHENRISYYIKKDTFNKQRAREIVEGRIIKFLAGKYPEKAEKVKRGNKEFEVHNAFTKGMVGKIGLEHLTPQEKKMMGVQDDKENN